MTRLLTIKYSIKTSRSNSGLLHFYNNENAFQIRRNTVQNDNLDILIKLGRTRMETLAESLGLSHPRVLRCSQWLDKPVNKVQRPRSVMVA